MAMLMLSIITSYLVLFVCATSDKVLEKLIPDSYRTERPFNDTPVPVQWSLLPFVVSDLSAMKMEFSVDVRICCEWRDRQLKIDSNDIIQLTPAFSTKLWNPWIRFKNCKGCPSEIINPHQTPYFIQNKSVTFLHRKQYLFTCVFDLTDYPFDTQTCSIDLQIMVWHAAINLSRTVEDELYYGYNIEENLLVPPEYRLNSLKRLTNACNDKRSEKDICFKYVFIFTRIATQHILIVFLPSMLIVILSWISFWLDVKLAAPRVALGLTSLLTLATQFNSAQRNLPAVSTIKALDIWIFMCIFMIFSSLIVYAISYTKHIKSQETIQPAQRPEVSFFKNFLTKMVLKFNFHQTNIDKKARILFPIVFIVFNIYFWFFYLC